METSPLERAIKAAGTQVELAKRIGRSQSTISEWIRRGWPSADACLAIEEATGVTVAELLRPAQSRKKPRAKARRLRQIGRSA